MDGNRALRPDSLLEQNVENINTCAYPDCGQPDNAADWRHRVHGESPNHHRFVSREAVARAICRAVISKLWHPPTETRDRVIEGGVNDNWQFYLDAADAAVKEQYGIL